MDVEKTISARETSISRVSSSVAITPDDDRHLSLWLAVRMYKKVVLYCLCLSFAVVLYGYDQAIVGSVSGIPAFQ